MPLALMIPQYEAQMLLESSADVYKRQTCALDVVWDFSDIMNGLMAVPNLICVLALSGTACRELFRYEKERGETRVRK